MKMETAIECLEYCKAQLEIERGYDFSGVEALEMAIKALEQKPCEDAISRSEVLDLIDSKDPDYKVIHFKEDVECLPSVSTEKTGHWILKRTFPSKLYDEHLNEYKCSECYREIRCTESQLVNYPFCHCGTKMVVDELVDELVDECKREKLEAEERGY